MGGFGGPADPKNGIIALRPFSALECIVLGYNNLFNYVFEILGQNRALGAKKGRFWPKKGMTTLEINPSNELHKWVKVKVVK